MRCAPVLQEADGEKIRPAVVAVGVAAAAVGDAVANDGEGAADRVCDFEGAQEVPVFGALN